MQDKFSQSKDEATRREIVKDLLRAGKPLTHIDYLTHLRTNIELFLGEVAHELKDSMNIHIKNSPTDTYTQKKELAREINAQAAYLGLAIRCPKTGLPSFIVADATGEPNIGRFQFRVMGGTNGRDRTASSVKLPELTFIPALDNRSRSASWTDKLREGSVNIGCKDR